MTMPKADPPGSKTRFLDVPVEPFEAVAGAPAEEILRRMERISFQGRNLAVAHRVWRKMLADDVLIFLGTAGALSAGGLRLLIAQLITSRAVDCLVSTGANLYHDLHENARAPALHRIAGHRRRRAAGRARRPRLRHADG